MDTGGWRSATAAAVLGLAGASATAWPADSIPGRGTAVAVVGQVTVPASELDRRERGRLAVVRAEEYRIKRQILDEIIEEELLRQEAARRGIFTEDLLKIEVEGKLVEPTGDDVKATFERLRASQADKPVAEVIRLMGASLAREERIAQRRAAFIGELRARATVSVLLEPPRVQVGLGDAPVRGAPDAPVTIVEFSDFRCSYCAQAVPTLRKVEERYGQNVRLAFRNYPLSIHEQAPKAAEAAACAQEQGKFWEMHERLFAQQNRLGADDLNRRADELGLDRGRFDLCLQSGKYAQRWRDDRSEGSRLGVTGTPTYFVNGRLLSGSQSLEAFMRVIDEELAGPRNTRPGAKH